MAEILHFEILRKHGQTNKHTDRHGHYNTSPSPYGGRGKNAAGGNFEKKSLKKKLRIDLKWREMVIFGHPKWPPPAIL